MKWWHAVGVIACSWNAGCATLQTGEAGIPLDAAGRAAPERSGALVIRSREIESLSSPHLPAIELGFENHTNDWQRISAVRIYAANPARSGPVAIVPDEGLRDWRAAMLQQKKVRDHNRVTAVELGTAGAMIVGEALSESDDRKVSIAGTVIQVIAASAYTAAYYNDRKHEAEALPLNESNHLLAGVISMPPLTTAKRWVVLHTPELAEANDLTLVLCYDLAGGVTERVLLGLKSPSHARHRWVR